MLTPYHIVRLTVKKLLAAPLRHGNLLTGVPARQADERIEPLACGAGVRIERIVSTGQASPPGFWYDQPGDEFVVLLAGAARLRFEDGELERDFELGPGDWVEIPVHVRHRVEWTQADPPTVWLAVHRDVQSLD
jgi:cupin 2 domain-containing protein